MGINKDFLIEGVPEKEDASKFIYAKCLCGVPDSYGIKIAPVKRSTEGRWYHFRCKECGLRAIIYA